MSDPVGHPPSQEGFHPYVKTIRYTDPPLDPITGFLDRKAALQAAAVLMADAGARHTRLCAIWLDIDRFRQVNESFGHTAGDGVIARIAERIRSVVGLACLMSRMGVTNSWCWPPSSSGLPQRSLLASCGRNPTAIAGRRTPDPPIRQYRHRP